MRRLKDQVSVLDALILSLYSEKEDLSKPSLGLGSALLQALIAAVALGLQPDSPDSAYGM